MITLRILLLIALLTLATPLIGVAQRSKNAGYLNRAAVKEVESRLAALGYWTGPVDGRFDEGSRWALLAFQRLQGRTLTGTPTLDELNALRSSSAPAPRDPGYAHVEVDLERQILLLIADDGRVRVLPVSTGSNETFVDDGRESIAYTPRGRFLVYDKGIGWETGPLGPVYYANYISGGVAIHGSRNVPGKPASHGCIRIPTYAAKALSKEMTMGTIVLVYDSFSFVSAKEWADNPQLREAALLSCAATDEEYLIDDLETEFRPSLPKRESMKRLRTKRPLPPPRA